MTAQPFEVACDESGWDGENLVGGNTDVFAHAGVHMPLEAAAGCLREIRGRIRSPAQEYKANHLLREKHRPVLEWLLDPSGPIAGRAQVHLTDKVCFLLGRLLEPLADGAAAQALYRDGPGAFGPERWRSFLEAANDLMRTGHRWDTAPRPRPPAEAFSAAVDALGGAGARGPVAETVELLRQARPRADALWTGGRQTLPVVPALDPMLPALVRTVLYWAGGGRQVQVVHDRQNALTPERLGWLAETAGRHRLAGLRLVESRSDPRVQLADFVAGVARKIASDALGGRADVRLAALLRPFVDASSVWADERSWALLGPAAETFSVAAAETRT